MYAVRSGLRVAVCYLFQRVWLRPADGVGHVTRAGTGADGAACTRAALAAVGVAVVIAGYLQLRYTAPHVSDASRVRLGSSPV